jgi:hypothetical protein
MRLTMVFLILPILAGFSSIHQGPAPSPDSFKSGTRARFRSRRFPERGWINGTLGKVFPEEGVKCLIIFSESIGGFVGLRSVDSLEIDRSGAILLRPDSTVRLPPPRWRSVSPELLHAQEHGCDGI